MNNPAIAVPYCMLGSLAINGTMGFAFLVALLFCMGDLGTTLDSPTGFPVIEIFRTNTNSRAASAAMTSFLILTAWLATIALLASAGRMVLSLARDKGMSQTVCVNWTQLISIAIPGYKYLAKLDAKSQLPTRSVVATSTVLVILGFVNIGSTTAFNAIISLAILGLHVSYLVPVALMLWHRLSSRRTSLIYGPWQLGRLGVPINIVSVVYLSYTTIFMVFPPYKPVTAENMNYSSLILGAVLIFSAVYWVWKGRREYTGPNIEMRHS